MRRTRDRAFVAATLLIAATLIGMNTAKAAYVCGLKPYDPTLNLRTCPNKSCDIILAVPNGTYVEVVSYAGVGQWMYVRVGGIEGYMSGRYLC
jgi:uncharacterized protein YraI